MQSFRIQSESRSRERINGEQQKRSLSYGDKLNNANNRRQLPSAPSNNTFNKNTKNVEPRIPEGESDLNVREPTPDYDTQSMASNIPPVESSTSKSKKRKEGRRSSSDSNGTQDNNIKRKLESSLSTSSHGSTKETSKALSLSDNTNNQDNNKTNENFDFEEKGKTPFLFVSYSIKKLDDI